MTTYQPLFNHDELGHILSFLPPQELLSNIQLVSKDFHHVVLNNDMIWKGHCENLFLSNFFNWEQSDLPTTTINTASGDNGGGNTVQESSHHFKLFTEWSKSIPRIFKVGRLPYNPNSNSGSEYERSIFSRFDTTKYSFKNLTQLVSILNIFSLTKNGKYFYENCFKPGTQEEATQWEYMSDEVAFAVADTTPYDFVPSIFEDTVWISLSDRKSMMDQFQYGYAIIVDEEYSQIAFNIPFGAFCLMILSSNQQENIKLVGDKLIKRYHSSKNTNNDDDDDREEEEEIDENDLVLGVSNPNEQIESLYLLF